MNRREPTWLPEIRDLCRQGGIKIAGWGADTVSVYAESPDRVAQINAQFRPLGFEPIDDADDAAAGLLLLSRTPAETRAKQHRIATGADISQRPLADRAAVAIVAALSVWLWWFGFRQPPPKIWIFTTLAALLALVTVREGRRLLGWRLDMSDAALRVRLDFQWHTIPWTDIKGVAMTGASVRQQEGVTLTLASGEAFALGWFSRHFARALCDQLGREITARHRT
jgi:hypothetical protein